MLLRLPAAMKQNADIHRVARGEALVKRRERFVPALAKFKASKPAAFAAIRARADAKQKALREAAREGVPEAELAAADALVASWRVAADWRCDYCGCELAQGSADRCADHALPKSKGGKHTVANLKRACRSCNSRKRDATVYFA